MREREKHITKINMSTNKHTEAVLLEFIKYPNNDVSKKDFRNYKRLLSEGTDVRFVSEIILCAAWRIHADATNKKLDFRTELRKAFFSNDFMGWITGVNFPNDLRDGIDKLTDAIIKDMGIETETKAD